MVSTTPVADQHAVAGALGAKRLCGERIGRNDGAQPHHRGQRCLEVVSVVFRLRLEAMWHLPVARR